MRPGGAKSVKGAGDYVTESDLASEEAIVEALARLAPGVPVLAEERGGARAATMWAVDPLDGTRNFTRGFPVVGVSVGLLDRGQAVAGAVVAPWLDLEFAGGPGLGVELNGERLPPLGAGHPGRAIVATGFPFRRPERRPRYLRVMEGAMASFEDLRRAGAASLDLAWTAGGSFDGFFELGLGTWDILAGAALVLGAGGAVSDWEGGSGWVESGHILAGTAPVHARLLELAAQAPKG